ncbi:hypothetical protein [Novipirellula artificiosorum]|nr:hypothetical protein [Novipirellula artificiosorum]
MQNLNACPSVAAEAKSMRCHAMRTARVLTHVILGLVFAAGCDSSDQRSPLATYAPAESVGPVRLVGNTAITPRDYLKTIFSRYHAAGSYRDSAQVRLTFTEQGVSKSEIAPLSVWFNHDLVYMRAYDARLWSDRDGLSAWIVDPLTSNFDSQVLRKPAVGRRPDLRTLLADPILVEKIAAGLAGPPPQLEWLFADPPMNDLFRPEHQFEFGEQKPIQQQTCQAIRVQADSSSFVFWIDIRQGLVRQVDLPPLIVPAQADQPAQTMELALELTDATFDAPVTNPQADSLPSKPKFVSRFLPLPPDATTPLLGRALDRWPLEENGKPFRFAFGPPLLRSLDSECITAMICLTGDPTSLAAAALLQQWEMQIPGPIRQRVRVVAIVDDSIRSLPDDAKASLGNAIRLPMVFDTRNKLIQQLGLTPGTLLLIDQHSQIVWTQSTVTEQSLPGLGVIIGDCLDGVDVPKRIAQQTSDDLRAYERAIETEAAKFAKP